MGAGQIGGIATLGNCSINKNNNNFFRSVTGSLNYMFIYFAVDMDFNNAAGFLGTPAEVTEGQYMVSVTMSSLRSNLAYRNQPSAVQIVRQLHIQNF